MAGSIVKDSHFLLGAPAIGLNSKPTHAAMPPKSLIALSPVALFLVFSYQQDAARDFDDGPAPDGIPDIRYFDVVQRTCALEVVLVVRSMEGRRTEERDTTPVPLVARPSGNLLACVPAPTE